MYSCEQLVEKLNSNNLFVDVATVLKYIESGNIQPVYETPEGGRFFDDTALHNLEILITADSAPQILEDIQLNTNLEDLVPAQNNLIHDEPDSIEPNGGNEPGINFEQPQKEEKEENEPNLSFEQPQEEEEKREENPVHDLAVLHEQTMQEYATDVNTEAHNNETLPALKLDVTQQTLSTIAATMAEKITLKMVDYFKNNDFAGIAVKLGKYMEENNLLKSKIKKTLTEGKKIVDENKKLSENNKKLLLEVKKLKTAILQQEKELKSFKPFLGNLYKKLK